MKINCQERTDIGPLLRQAWAYGETIEIPVGCYYSSPQTFPAVGRGSAWGEARAAIEGDGCQGIEIQPLPGSDPGQPMWLFTGGRSRVTNLLFADPNSTYQHTYVQFGDGMNPITNCTFDDNDIRQYRRGVVAKKVFEFHITKNNAMGGPGDVIAYDLENCNGVHMRDNWTQGGKNVLWRATEHGGGMNEAFAFVGGGMAEVERGIEMHGGDCFQIGDASTCFDSTKDGIGIELVGTAEFPIGGGVITGWIGGNGTKIKFRGVGVFGMNLVGCTLVGSGPQDGFVLDGTTGWPSGGIWEHNVVGSQFRNLKRGIVYRNGAMRVNVDSTTRFIGVDQPQVVE